MRKRERLDEIADELMEENDEVKERAYQRFKIRVEQDAKALESLERLQGQQTAKLPRPELAQQILSARADMETSLEARMKVQSCLNQLIDVILMDPNDRSATIVMIDGNLVVKMDKYGKVIGVADSLLMLQPRTYVMSDGTIATFDPRPLGVASDMPLGEMGVARVIDQLRHGALRPTVDPSQQRWKQQPDPAVLA
ncbi:MAG: hypothetical protein B7X90_17540 [Novosphingobium sp. 17-62-19]|nr:MAG: hypothetical protein B7X90_17540 [Novosphingobium sp. 17-62-19]